MSRSSNILLPPFINKYTAPALFLINNTQDPINDIYFDPNAAIDINETNGINVLASNLGTYTDPMVNPALKNPVYSQEYTNANGIKVNVQGSYNDVRSVVAVLNAYPPKKIDTQDTGMLVDLADTPISPNSPASNIPKMSKYITGDGKDMIIGFDNKHYSGSGILVLVLNDNVPAISNILDNAKFMLFKSTATNNYEDLGGKIDSSFEQEPDANNILIKNAIKETKEESLLLFNINNRSLKYVDITHLGNSNKRTNMTYRGYLYVIKYNVKKLHDYTKHNYQYINTSPNPMFTDEYKETSTADFFDYYELVNGLKQNKRYGQTITGNFVTISDRTISLIKEFNKMNIFDSIVKEDILTPTTKLAANSDDSYVLTV